MKKKQKSLKRPSRKPVSKKPSRFKRSLHALRFVPAFVIAVFATSLSLQPQMAHTSPARSVLAYATNTSQAGLLSSTNTQRANNGVPTLASNGLLTAAAQAKAEDMVVRNYWSHQTPDGQQPWVFISNAGYKYASAGENLAYGFLTSSDTITGWMNSPPHKANLLSTNFTEVGFGIANSPDYVSKGQQTVVVAMYGKPVATSAPVAQPAPTTTQPKPKTAAAPAVAKPAPAPAPAPEPENNEETPPLVEEPITTTEESQEVLPQTAAQKPVQRVNMLANGSIVFSSAVVTMAVLSIGILWLLHKGFHIIRFIKTSEKFVVHHLHLDLTVLAVVYLGFTLLSNVGIVR